MHKKVHYSDGAAAVAYDVEPVRKQIALQALLSLYDTLETSPMIGNPFTRRSRWVRKCTGHPGAAKERCIKEC